MKKQAETKKCGKPGPFLNGEQFCTRQIGHSGVCAAFVEGSWSAKTEPVTR